MNVQRWDGKEIVITDFGIAQIANSGKSSSGIPGFASPEQLLGRPHMKSDNYAFGKLMVLIFLDWKSAWTFLAQPAVHQTLLDMDKYPMQKKFRTLIYNLLRVRLHLRNNINHNLQTLIFSAVPMSGCPLRNSGSRWAR